MISIVTPLHAAGNPFVAATYESLKQQTVRDWEWVVLTNHGGRAPAHFADDPRVRVVCAPEDLEGVGALKKAACAIAAGDRIVELDADDLLADVALERVADAFAGGADFVYSDFAEFQDGSWAARWDSYPYRADCGWECYEVEFDGHPLIAMQAPPATAHNVRRVEWAPNHVRAWTRAAYDAVGGHDASMAVGDDHDLIVRLFLAGKRFHLVEECLYGYRSHAANTVRTHNRAIQDATERVYNRNIWALAEKFATDAGLACVDLCGAIDSPAGYRTLDRSDRADVQCDLDDRWPLEDSSVGVLRAHDALEHLRDPVHTMNEAWRVLAPGGFFMISVPSTSGKGAFCDPTHVSFWNDLSFRYYASRQFARYVPAFRGQFQVSRLLEWFPSDWHRANNVPYVEAHLFCCKDGFRAMGEYLW